MISYTEHAPEGNGVRREYKPGVEPESQRLPAIELVAPGLCVFLFTFLNVKQVPEYHHQALHWSLSRHFALQSECVFKPIKVSRRSPS